MQPAASMAAPEGDDWIHEIKFDGYRMQAHIENGAVRLLTRGGHDWTKRYRRVADELATLKVENAILDGEMTVLNTDGTPSLHRLQRPYENQRDLHYFGFDLLHLNGESFVNRPLEARKQALEPLIPPKPMNETSLHYSSIFTEKGSQVLEHARKYKLEGIVSKKRGSLYRSGTAREWVKTKCINQQEMVVGGFTRNAAAVTSLWVGTFEGDELRFAGVVTSGIPDMDKKLLHRRLTPVIIERPPFTGLEEAGASLAHVQWVKPEIVATISFEQWPDRGGMRSPVYQALRLDKPAREVRREYPPAP
ncbi:MAG TPA: non-homologous end-joining DNA ligase [Alphaproteobacteria bacterium]|nr:non-homologous end-joining DNA ligase [Alphaproteobacteria bacterium]